MKITRRFTSPDTDVFETVEWTRRSSKISGMDGKVVFEMNDAEVPASWSQLATDIMVSKYFRKAGVPTDGGPNGIAAPDFEEGHDVELGPERSARQVIHRLAGCCADHKETLDHQIGMALLNIDDRQLYKIFVEMYYIK